MKRFEGKVAIVTGGAGGLGRAIAGALAREGAAVLLADLDGEGAGQAASELAAAGGIASEAPADVTRQDHCERMVAGAKERWGGLDYLVNCAGLGEGATVAQLDEATWDRVVDVNLKGTFLASKAALPELIARGGGAILNLSSLAGLIGGYGMGAYAASKAGVIQLTRVLAVEAAPHGIRVNALCPVWIEGPMVERFLQSTPGPKVVRRYLTGMIPMARFGKAEEVAAPALFLLSDEASFITGVALPVDGGALCR